MTLRCTLPDTERWAGLRSIGMVERTCQTGDLQTTERRYFINAIVPMPNALRMRCVGTGALKTGSTGDSTWSSTKTQPHPQRQRPAIMTSLRHLCINLFAQKPSSMGLAKKRSKPAGTMPTALTHL